MLPRWHRRHRRGVRPAAQRADVCLLPRAGPDRTV